jgi:hypothetical protein
MRILPCSREHIPAVIELLADRSAQDDPRLHAEGCRYLEEVFFGNPWYDPELPSLVCQGASGRIDGFLGVLAKPMVFEQEPLRAALSCKLRVRSPAKGEGPRNPFIAFGLIKRFLEGPQDLSAADWATEDAKKLFEACGSLAIPSYSLHWYRPIRPAQALLTFMEAQRGRSRSPALSLLAGMADLVGTKVVHRSRAAGGSSYTLDQLDTRLAVETLERAPGFSLRPHYDVASLDWLLEMAQRRAVGGCFRAAMVKDDAGHAIGWFVYLQSRRQLGLVLQLFALSGHHGTVLNAAIDDAADKGLALLLGGVDGHQLHLYDDNRCLLRGGASFLIHSRRRALVEAFLSGRALFTLLDGEGWMRRDLVE